MRKWQVKTRPRSTRRLSILRAALESFEELGYETATIEDIRRRARASIGSIYHHFGSKAGIAAALYVEGLADYQDRLLERMKRARSARSLVRGVVLHHLEWARANPAWARYLLRMRRVEAVAAMETELRHRNAAFMRQALEIVRPHVESGKIRRMPPELFFAQLVGPAQELLRLRFSGPARIKLGDAPATLAEAAWRAVRVAP